MAKCCDITAGELKHRILFESETTTGDGSGGFISTWAEVATVWAKVQNGGGREKAEAMQLKPQTDYVLTVRYRSDMLAPAGQKMRATVEGRLCNITSVEDIELAKRWLKIKCTAGAVV